LGISLIFGGSLRYSTQRLQYGAQQESGNINQPSNNTHAANDKLLLSSPPPVRFCGRHMSICRVAGRAWTYVRTTVWCTVDLSDMAVRVFADFPKGGKHSEEGSTRTFTRKKQMLPSTQLVLAPTPLVAQMACIVFHTAPFYPLVIPRRSATYQHRHGVGSPRAGQSGM